MQNESWNVEPGEIRGEIGFRERFDAEIRSGEPGHHALQPEGLPHSLRDCRARPVVAVEGQAEVLPELRTVGLNGGPELIECFDRGPDRIALGLQHQGWNGADQDGLRDPFGSMPTDVTGDLSAPCRVTTVNCVS